MDYARTLADRASVVLASLGSSGLPRREAPAPSSDGRRLTSWLELPIALHAAAAGTERAVADPTLLDVLWGQYGLFLAIRFQDDLFDGQRDDPRLQFVADVFLAESLAAFGRVPALGERFWETYRRSLRHTAEAILVVHELERRPGRFGAEHLHWHARVGSIFTVGTAAMCDLTGRDAERDRVERLQAALAVFSQISDDISDLRDDIARERYTFVANALVEPVADEPDAAGALRALGRWEPVWRALRAAADEASAAVDGCSIAAIRELGEDPAGRLEQLRAAMHRADVEWVFGALPS